MARQIKTHNGIYNGLVKRFPGIPVHLHNETELVVSGEDGYEYKGRVFADYYLEFISDPEEKTWKFGILNVFHNWLEARGWHCEWIDPGTIGIYRDF